MLSDEEPIDPLALALFGIRDHVRHHHDCTNKRGVNATDDECALADIVTRYASDAARAAERALVERTVAQAFAPVRSLVCNWKAENKNGPVWALVLRELDIALRAGELRAVAALRPEAPGFEGAGCPDCRGLSGCAEGVPICSTCRPDTEGAEGART